MNTKILITKSNIAPIEVPDGLHPLLDVNAQVSKEANRAFIPRIPEGSGGPLHLPVSLKHPLRCKHSLLQWNHFVPNESSELVELVTSCLQLLPLLEHQLLKLLIGQVLA